MRSHLVAILIAGLTLLPIYRASAVATSADPQPMSGMSGETCPICPHDNDEDPSAMTPCCAAEHTEEDQPEPCRQCPPICCALTPLVVLSLPELPPAPVPTHREHVFPRPRNEHALSCTLAPDPPVPIS